MAAPPSPETESENNLVRFLLCFNFQYLRLRRHCTLASDATALPGVKRPQKAKKPKHAYLSRRIEEKPEARFSKREFMLGSLKKPRIHNLLIL